MRQMLWWALFFPLGAGAEPATRAGLWLHETSDSPPIAADSPAQWQTVRELLRTQGVRLSREGRMTHMCFPQQSLEAGDAAALAALGPGARITHFDVSDTAFTTLTQWPCGRMESRYRWLQSDCEELVAMGTPPSPPPAASPVPTTAMATPPATASAPVPRPPGAAASVQSRSIVAASAPTPPAAPAPAPAAKPSVARQAPAARGKSALGAPSTAGASQHTKWLLFRSDVRGLRYRFMRVRQEGSTGHLQIQIAVDESAHCHDPRCDGYILVLKYPDENNETREIHLRFSQEFRGPYTYPELLKTQFKTWPDGSTRSFDPHEGVMLGNPPRPVNHHEFLVSCLDAPLVHRSRHQCSNQFKPQQAISVP